MKHSNVVCLCLDRIPSSAAAIFDASINSAINSISSDSATLTSEVDSSLLTLSNASTVIPALTTSGPATSASSSATSAQVPGVASAALAASIIAVPTSDITITDSVETTTAPAHIFKPRQTHIQQWEAMFSSLLEYGKVNGHYNVPCSRSG